MKTLNWDSLTVADAFFVRKDNGHSYMHLALWIEEKLYKLLQKTGGPTYQMRVHSWYVAREGVVGNSPGYYDLHSPDSVRTEHDERFRMSNGAEGKTWYFLSYRIPRTSVLDGQRLLGVSVYLPAINANVLGGRKVVEEQSFTLFNREELLSCLIAGVRAITKADNCKMYRCDCHGDTPCLSHVLATIELMEHGMLINSQSLVQLAYDKYKLLCPECQQC